MAALSFSWGNNASECNAPAPHAHTPTPDKWPFILGQVLANVAYYIMVAHICYKCCETYSEPAPGLKKQEESKAKSSAKKKA